MSSRRKKHNSISKFPSPSKSFSSSSQSKSSGYLSSPSSNSLQNCFQRWEEALSDWKNIEADHIQLQIGKPILENIFQ